MSADALASTKVLLSIKNVDITVLVYENLRLDKWVLNSYKDVRFIHVGSLIIMFIMNVTLLRVMNLPFTYYLWHRVKLFKYIKHNT